MRILIPILCFARGGGTRVLSELANEWIRRGHEVVFLCPDSSDEPYFPTIAKILWVNGQGGVFKTRASKAKSSGSYHLQALFQGLRKVGHQYDVILANQSLTAWPVAIVSCGSASKIYYVQAYEPEYYINMRNIKDYLLMILSALSYHLPIEKIVNAPIYYRYKNLRASTFVPPGLDLNIFKPLENQRDIQQEATIVIGCIGRHEPEKGTIYALRAFEELYKIDKRFILRVAYGNLPDGWHHKRCEIIVPNNDKELADFYRSVDILIAAGTVQHGAPHYPVLESLATGTAVVTTGYMGATDETAWIVKNKDVQSIVDSVFKILSDSVERRNKIVLGLKAVQKFSWHSVAEKMMQLICVTAPNRTAKND